MKNEIIDFLHTKTYKYSVSKVDIPSIILDSMSSISKSPFKVGDSTDIGNINLSDMRILGKDEYTKQLHFVLVSDTICVLVYTEGGFGRYDVIDYFQYRGEYKHRRYTTTDTLTDTVKLENYMRSNPAVVMVNK